MTLSAILAEVSSWSVEDRIRLAQAIWDTISEGEALLELSDDQKRELDLRIAELDANPDQVLTWEQIKAHVQREKP